MTQRLSNSQLVQLADRFGTPLYVYHAEKIEEQYQKLTQAFSRTNTVFFYACKALTNINILTYVKSLGANVDCSSINEVKLALHAGFTPDRILYTSNGIAFSEIQEAKELGVIINIDSISNLEKRMGILILWDFAYGPTLWRAGILKFQPATKEVNSGFPLNTLTR